MTWIVTVESRRTHSHRELHKYSETKASEPVTLALAPTSNIVVHVVSDRRMFQLEGPCDILWSPSTRAIASDCFGDGNFTLSRPFPQSPNNSRGIST